jgi:hypothetical protein
MGSLWEAAAFKDADYFATRFNFTLLQPPKKRFSFIRRKERKKSKYLLPEVTFSSKERQEQINRDLNERNYFGINPFHTAIFYNNFQVVKLFMALDANLVNNPLIRTTGEDQALSWTYPLHLAIIFGHKKIFKALLKNGADPFLRDNLGQNGWDVTRVTFQKRFWNRLDKWCKLKRKQAEEAPIASPKGPPIYKKKIYAKSQESLVSRRLMAQKLIKSYDDLTLVSIEVKRKVPHGPWDLEGCFIKAACGTCPETSDIMSEKSASTTETESTTLPSASLTSLSSLNK